jgi:glycosyltransferase involved in cell wall biosynthesis
LHFGGIAQSKGTALLLEAIALIVGEGRKCHLLIAGMSHHACLIHRTAAACHLAGENYTVLPYLSDQELVEVYQTCDLHCMPSLAEGFGLPVIEAASQAVPSLVTPLQVFREVMGDAALYIANWSANAIAAALKSAMNQDLTALGLHARARAMQYSFARVHERHARPCLHSLMSTLSNKCDVEQPDDLRRVEER